MTIYSNGVRIDFRTVADDDIGAQTVAASPATLALAAVATSTQTAVDALITDINDLKAKMRTAGLMAS